MGRQRPSSERLLVSKVCVDEKMSKKCNTSTKVRKAGRTLSTNKSPAKKSDAGKTLVEHKQRSH